MKKVKFSPILLGIVIFSLIFWSMGFGLSPVLPPKTAQAITYTLESTSLLNVQLGPTPSDTLLMTFDSALPEPSTTCNIGQPVNCFYGVDLSQNPPQLVGLSGLSIFDNQSQEKAILLLLRADMPALGINGNDHQALAVPFDFGEGTPIDAELTDTFNIATENFTGDSGLAGNGYQVGCDGDCSPVPQEPSVTVAPVVNNNDNLIGNTSADWQVTISNSGGTLLAENDVVIITFPTLGERAQGFWLNYDALTVSVDPGSTGLTFDTQEF
jgi:hypothetical protein